MHHDPQPAGLRHIAEIWSRLTPDEQHLAARLVDELAAPTLSDDDRERLLAALADSDTSEDSASPAQATIRAMLGRTRSRDQPGE